MLFSSALFVNFSIFLVYVYHFFENILWYRYTLCHTFYFYRLNRFLLRSWVKQMFKPWIQFCDYDDEGLYLNVARLLFIQTYIKKILVIFFFHLSFHLIHFLIELQSFKSLATTKPGKNSFSLYCGAQE